MSEALLALRQEVRTLVNDLFLAYLLLRSNALALPANGFSVPLGLALPGA